MSHHLLQFSIVGKYFERRKNMKAETTVIMFLENYVKHKHT